MGTVNRFSKVFGFQRSAAFKGTFVSKSQKLFIDLGLTQFNDGMGTLMPFLVRPLRKLERIVHKEMKAVGANECLLPILTDLSLLEKSGRAGLSELFKVNGRGNQSYILSPTCEEAMTHLVSLYKELGHKNFPIRLYQICTKFRDEKRGRSGMLRSKEFIMKDLYCFDTSEESCEECYQEVMNQYHHFFDNLKVPYVCVEGATGSIGGLKSHEFHFLSDAGQDKIIFCSNCDHIENLYYITDHENIKCPKCQSNNVTVKNSIEVGHTFKLGTRYTEPFNATFVNNKGERQLLQMSCFGLGLTRILAASVEVLCSSEEIKWPISLAPYLVSIVPPKAGSKEEAAAGDSTNIIYRSLNQSLQDDIIIDDRTSLTTGKRFQHNKKLGYPFQVLIGKSICNDPPLVEVFDSSTGSTNFVQIPDVNQFILDKLADMFKNQGQEEKTSAQFQQ